MNKFVSWQTNGPQDHNIILNQLLDHPLNLQGNLRQRSFVAASEWFQKSVSRTCFPIRNHANKFIIIFNEDNHNSKDKWKEFQSFQEAWKFLRDLRRNSSSNFNQLSGSKKILHNSFFQRQFKRG
jgi:hypothetical protein